MVLDATMKHLLAQVPQFLVIHCHICKMGFLRVVTHFYGKKHFLNLVPGPEFRVTYVRLACYDGFESFLCIYFVGPVDPAPVKRNSKLCQAVDVIRRCMHQSNYALHEGCVYRKVPESKYTYR